MRQFYWLRSMTVFVCFFIISSLQRAIAQVQTPRYNVSMTANSNGFYEYLPQGYDPADNNQTYPLLIFVHGGGDLGDGSSSTITGLSLVKKNGPPLLIDQNIFPASFTVNGHTYSFIVISPQFINWPISGDIADVIDYSIQHYHVDINRIYITGLSMGGGVTFEYAGGSSINANKLAAIVPVSGASWPDNARARVIATANLPVWATHNDGDPNVSVYTTNEYIAEINAAPPPAPLAKKTIFHNNIHDAWTATYDLNFREDGMNVYEWMLQYQRNNNALPVILSSYSVTVSGESQATIIWSTTYENNNQYFSIEHSVNGTDFSYIGRINSANNPAGSNYSFIDRNAANGDNYYRLSQTDIDGRVTYFDIKKVTLKSITDNKIHLYPNPAIDQVTIQINDRYSGKIQLRILDVNGKVLKTVESSKPNNLFQQTLSVQKLPAGHYVMELKGDNYNNSIPFIKN